MIGWPPHWLQGLECMTASVDSCAHCSREAVGLLLSGGWRPSETGLDDFVQFRVQQSTELGSQREEKTDPSEIVYLSCLFKLFSRYFYASCDTLEV